MVMIYRPTISGSGAGLIVANRPLLTVFGRGRVMTYEPTTSSPSAGSWS